jgi:hypothetical protein
MFDPRHEVRFVFMQSTTLSGAPKMPQLAAVPDGSLLLFSM